MSEHKPRDEDRSPEASAETRPSQPEQEQPVNGGRPAVDDRIGVKVDGADVFSKTMFDLFR